MHHPSRTHTTDEVGYNRSKIVDHFVRTCGCHWPISLAAIDQQGQMLLLTVRTDEAGATVRDPPCGERPGTIALPAYASATNMATEPFIRE
jgi:hypothetical protein